MKSSASTEPVDYLPGVAVILFAAQLAMLFFQAPALLSDPGTGWHLRHGALILEQGRIAAVDPFSWTAAGKPWVSFEWLADVVFAGLERVGGLPAVAAAVMVGFALLPYGLLRFLLRAGITFPLALLYTAGTLIVFQWHVLARPHVFTYVFLLWLIVRGHEDRLTWRWALVVFALWANLHAGFMLGLVWWGAMIAGQWLDGVGWEKTRTSLGVWVIALGATLLNPWGWNLHRQILDVLMHLRSLPLWEEFASPNFYVLNGPSAAVLGLLVIFLLGRTAGRAATWRWATALPVLLFMVAALKSQRHAFPLLLVAALPASATLQIWWQRWKPAVVQAKMEAWTQQENSRRGQMGWALVVALGLSLWWGSSAGAKSLRVGEKNVSAAAVAYITERATTWKRPLTTTRNGGTLIYYGYPRMRVSFDDRSDFYGDTVNFSQFRLQELRRGWREVLAEGDYDAAVVSPTDGLRTGLESLAEWRNVFEDKTVVIFER